MSGGKKKFPKKRMYAESEVKRAVRKAAEDATAKVILLCVLSATDQFKCNDDETVEFVERMKRYVEYEQTGLVDLNLASESLYKNTGIDLRLVKGSK